MLIALAVLAVIIAILVVNLTQSGSGWLTAFLIIGGIGVIAYYLYDTFEWDVVKSYFQSLRSDKKQAPTADEIAKILHNLEELNKKNPDWYKDLCGESYIDELYLYQFKDLVNPSEENLRDEDFQKHLKGFNASHYIVIKRGENKECANVKGYLQWLGQQENQRVDAEDGGQISAIAKYKKRGIDFYKTAPHNILIRDWRPILENPDTRTFELVEDGMSQKLYSVSSLSHIRHQGEVHGTHPPEKVYKLVPVK